MKLPYIMHYGGEIVKVSNRMKVNIIVCLIGIIFIGIYSMKQYSYMTKCNELMDKYDFYDQKVCDRILKGDNNEVEDWEQYKRDVKDAKFKHDLYEEVERMNR